MVNTVGNTSSCTGGSISSCTGGSISSCTGGGTSSCTGGSILSGTGGGTSSCTGGGTSSCTGGGTSSCTGGGTSSCTGGSILSGIYNEIKEINKQKEEINKQKEEKKLQDIKKDVVLFFSFDVVNSTSYKTVNYYGWAQVLNLLFKELRINVSNEISGSEMWRVLGDEAIFIIKIRDEERLREYINKIFKIMVTTIYKLKRGEFFNFDSQFDLMKLQNILSLKAAAWIAAVSNIGDISDKNIIRSDTDNIFERYQSQDGCEIFEFLGNDIDTGFRIATQTQEGRLVLSFELAYLISQKTESLSYLHIVTYKKLKGVWKNKLYPVIWYHDPKAFLKSYKREVTLIDSFSFDACAESDLIKEYYDNRDTNRNEKSIRDVRMYVEPFYALNKIMRDRELEEKVSHLQKLIKEAVLDQTKYIDMKLVKLHCVAVCFKKDDDEIKILVAKRAETREKLKGQWEFGCSKAVIDKSIAQIVKEEYKKDFNVDIEPVLDEAREMPEPIPIAIYHVARSSYAEDTNESDKGIIILAEIKGDYKTDNFKKTAKHEKVEWITEKELPQVKERFENCIPDLKQTLVKAFQQIKSL